MSSAVRFLTIVLCLLAFVGSGQDQRVGDSPKVELTRRLGKESLPYLVDLAVQFVDNDNERALTLMNQAETVSRHFADSSWVVTCMRIRGQILYRLQRTDEAVDIVRALLAVVKGNKFDCERLRILIPYAVVCTYKSELDKALEMCFEAHQLAIARKDTARLESVLINLGVVVMSLLVLFILACCVALYRSYRLKQLLNVSLEERIRARTHQLECSRNELLTTLNERDALLCRAEKDVLETVRTIKGLCHTGKEEIGRFATYSYLEKIENISGWLSGQVSLLLGKRKLR